MKRFLIFAVLILACATARATNITAASASTADVQTAVNSAVDGDTVLIPNGTVTWTTGISTSKQIIIRAQNYTATPAGTSGAPSFTIRGGATSRNVTITNNSATPLFTFTSGNSFNCGVGGIRFNEGTGGGAHVSINGSGTKVPLIFDCYFQNKSRNSPDDAAIVVGGRGGVMWNCLMEGTQAVTTVGEGGIRLKSTGGMRAWDTSSTMGTLDTSGNVNFYIEDTTFRNVGAAPDIDDEGRWVFRNGYYDGAWGATHGFTSIHGGRHWEYYDTLFDSNTAQRNISNRYFWCRAGTGIFTDNKVMEDLIPSDYGGTPVQLNIGDNTSPISSYPANRSGAPGGCMQPGWGHNGTTFIVDPIYIWNQTGDFPYAWSFQGSPGDWSTVVQLNRDIFVNNGAKPGYTKYTYPHPARAVVEGGGTDTIAPTPNPMTFSVSPTAVDAFSVTMTASAATDDQGGTISYFFNQTGAGAGGTDSGWQSGVRTYTDTGLSPSTTYTYRVKARDSSLNETAYSGTVNVTTPSASPGSVNIGTLNVTNLRVGP